ncbi:hypothetical protein NEOLEDRAFT_173523 [Neolentinus lepideus HHB14362 ss-1]|uniref:Uncharacterized protein n=1 Tax=Neolentinus lepideus HHB14362 ss-1 TaxID=1314782 RepID=A0A165MIB9_9AGAM|nr:hypothetical protein NEOLEDRAFT_173523 [Neolentinus lepideus HHB14362 ss-1]
MLYTHLLAVRAWAIRLIPHQMFVRLTTAGAIYTGLHFLAATCTSAPYTSSSVSRSSSGWLVVYGAHVHIGFSNRHYRCRTDVLSGRKTRYCSLIVLSRLNALASNCSWCINGPNVWSTGHVEAVMVCERFGGTRSITVGYTTTSLILQRNVHVWLSGAVPRLSDNRIIHCTRMHSIQEHLCIPHLSPCPLF